MGALVRGEDSWHTTAGYPAAEEGAGTVGSSGGFQGKCLSPPGGAVDDFEEVRASSGDGAYKIHVEVAEAAV